MKTGANEHKRRSSTNKHKTPFGRLTILLRTGLSRYRKGAHRSEQHDCQIANKDNKKSDHGSLFAVKTYATVTHVIRHSATRSHSSPCSMAPSAFVRAIINFCMIRGISCVVGLVLLRRNDGGYNNDNEQDDDADNKAHAHLHIFPPHLLAHAVGAPSEALGRHGKVVRLVL